MIYNNEYEIIFFEKEDGTAPVLEYIEKLRKKEKAKVLKYLEFLREKKGILDEPYSKHILGKIRELRVDFANNKNRIFYFCFVNKKIILLHSFLKKTQKTPKNEIKKATTNLKLFLEYKNNYEEK